MDEVKYLNEMMVKARKAQAGIADYNQAQVDAMVKAIAKVVYDNAEMLAKMAVEETAMGVYEDKVAKNKGKSKVIWNDLKDKKSVDIIKYDDAEKMYYVAKPIGVIGSVTPTTNPTVTAMSNGMFALKGRNAIIFAPHPRAKGVTVKTVQMMNAELKKLGAPDNLMQIIEEPSIELTQLLMKTTDLVVATGGAAMVKSAYSSGKPSIGVGPGNVQVILDRDIDYKAAAQKVIAGRIFDNGIICSGEQTIQAPADKYNEVIEAFKAAGAYYIEDQKIVDKFRTAIFPDGHITHKDLVGQNVQVVGKAAGVDIPAGTKVILLKAKGLAHDDILCKEKMCPVLAIMAYDKFEDAVENAKKNLLMEGAGHSTAMHSNNKANIEYAGIKLPVSRLVVNAPSSTTAGGSLYNSFAPTTTLGCGSWGNNAFSENITYKHFINVSRIGLVKEGIKVPTDDEIWS